MNIWQELLSIFSSGLEFGLLNCLMVLGLMIALRFASFPDLTIEGALPIGAAICAVSTLSGIPPLLSIFLGGLAGSLAGSVTASLHLLTGMSRLLAGIIMMTALYAISLRVMQGSNVPLFDVTTWYSEVNGWDGRCLRTIVLVLPITVLLTVFFHTEFGLLLRASAENWNLVKKLGKPCWLYLLVTLAISNGLVGLSGALLTQSNRFADVGFGSGSIITSLAALLLGETILIPTSVGRQIIAAILGSFLYSSIFSLALSLGLHPWDLKLVSACFVLLAILISKRFSGGMETRRIGCDPL